MLTQPFIENAIEHGLKGKPIPGTILVKFEKQPGMLTITIKDNGIGREKASQLLQNNKDHKSMATKIMQERIKILNKKRKRKITMEIIDLKDDRGEAEGTMVMFSVPV
jgi:sensor histidine kinase YesM